GGQMHGHDRLRRSLIVDAEQIFRAVPAGQRVPNLDERRSCPLEPLPREAILRVRSDVLDLQLRLRRQRGELAVVAGGSAHILAGRRAIGPRGIALLVAGWLEEVVPARRRGTGARPGGALVIVRADDRIVARRSVGRGRVRALTGLLIAGPEKMALVGRR